MLKRIFFILPLLTGCFAGNLFSAPEINHPLLEQAKQERSSRYQFALQHGVETGLTPEGKSFYLLWLPQGRSTQEMPPLIVTISGHSGWAFDDFFVWEPFAKARGYGVLSVQWWLGEGERINDYLKPVEIYRAIGAVLEKEKIRPGTVLFHGFSRGATNTYAIAAMDRSTKNNYFALVIANAGRPNSNYPPIRDVEQGRFGPRPLEGSQWITFGGAKDPNPERDGIQGMREAGDWIRKYGGVVDLAIEDPEQGHGGFHRNPKNTEVALDVFEKLRLKNA